MSRDEIIETLSDCREQLRKFGVRRIGVFGSAARGDATEHSDLDFLVELERKTFDAYMDLKFFLEELFGRSVDLVLADGIKPRLRKTILKETVYAPGP